MKSAVDFRDLEQKPIIFKEMAHISISKKTLLGFAAGIVTSTTGFFGVKFVKKLKANKAAKKAAKEEAPATE